MHGLAYFGREAEPRARPTRSTKLIGWLNESDLTLPVDVVHFQDCHRGKYAWAVLLRQQSRFINLADLLSTMQNSEDGWCHED